MTEVKDLVIKETTQLEKKTKPKFFQWVSVLIGPQRRLGSDRKTAPEILHQTKEEAMKNRPVGDAWELKETEDASF